MGKKIADLLMDLVIFTVVSIACFAPLETSLVLYAFSHKTLSFFVFFACFVIVAGWAQVFLFFTWLTLTRHIWKP